MKFLLAFAIFAIVLTYVNGQADPWKDYKTKQGKKYSAKDDAKRKKIFLDTDAKIKKHNSQKNAPYQLGLNQFSDMTADELTKYLGAVRPANITRSLESTVTIDMADRQLPDSFDYRTSFCMPAIKNQGNCGSCWAFSAITPLEFAQCKKTGSPVVLSEQHLMDCDPYDAACAGGWPSNAWYYLQNVAGGSAKQSLYPYTARKGSCKFTSSMRGATITSYGSLPSRDAVYMQSALMYYGPISVTLGVGNTFFSYKSGVYSDVTCDQLEVNHAVVIVGWGTQNGFDYWIVRNSWGTNWGMWGYFLIQRGVNRCNIENFPVVIVSVV